MYMELKISCDASIKLKKMSGTKNVRCEVADYEVDEDTLVGNMKIFGSYYKDDLDNDYPFSELVPFTVVFRDKNFTINEIRSENFNCNEIFNQGLDCHFDIVIDYEKTNEDVKLDEDIELGDDLDLFSEPGFDENIIMEAEEELDDEQISEKYDNMLNDVLSKRDDNFLEEDELEVIDLSEKEIEQNLEESEDERELDEEVYDELEKAFEEDEVVDSNEEEIKIERKSNVSISNSETKDRLTPFSKKIKEKYDSIRVYYLNDESDVDHVCQREDIEISKAYKEFNDNKRIIIK